jgi:uncharacterized hydrophobic protein (TIGR00271 family)
MQIENTPGASFRILIAVGEPDHLAVLLALSAPLARARQGRVTALYVGTSESPPAWFQIPEHYQDVVDPPVVVNDTDVGGAVLAHARKLEPDLLFLHWRGRPTRGRYLLGRTLDPVIEYAPCDVAVVRVSEPPEAFVARMESLERVLVPSGGGPNASLALALGLDLSPQAEVTALRVASPNMGATAISAQWAILRSAVEPFQESGRTQPRVVLSSGVVDGILQEAAEGYDMVLIGATGESFVDRLVFGNLPQELAQKAAVPVVIVRRCGNMPSAALRRIRWRIINLMTQLATEERIAVYRQVRRAARPDRDYYVMMTLAAGIASFGLLLSSAAVIIGAMVVAPMMSALIGVGMGIVQGDAPLLRLSLRTVTMGTGIVILVSGLVGLMAPGAQLTGEMLARTSPNLLDLAVALISGAAAAYANAREDVANALPGIAIAVALAPPLATLGLTAALGAPQAAMGAFLLFLTNLVGIVAAVAVVFLWMGFRPNIVEEPRARTFRGGVLGTVILCAAVTVVLGVLSARSLRENALRQQVSRLLEQRISLLGQGAQVSSWTMQTGSVVAIKLSVETDHDLSITQVLQLQLALEEGIRRPVALDVTVIPVRRLAPSLPAESRAPPGDAPQLIAKGPTPYGVGP